MVEQVSGAGKAAMDLRQSVYSAAQNEPRMAAEKTESSASRQAAENKADEAVLNLNGTRQEEEQKKELSKEDLEEMNKELNRFMRRLKCNIRFEYNEKLDRMTTRVIDRETNEVIKEFPPKEVMKSLEKIHDWIGMLLDEKA